MLSTGKEVRQIETELVTEKQSYKFNVWNITCCCKCSDLWLNFIFVQQQMT